MITVGIGEYAITDDVNESIITYSLGSCVAVVIHCPVTKHTALAHIALPDGAQNEKADYLTDKPSYYANVIVPKLVDYFLGMGFCKKNQLQIYLIGGAESLNKNDIFQVGNRNIEMIKSILRHYRLTPRKEDIGGNISRTVCIDVSNGELTVKSLNMMM